MILESKLVINNNDVGERNHPHDHPERNPISQIAMPTTPLRPVAPPLADEWADSAAPRPRSLLRSPAMSSKMSSARSIGPRGPDQAIMLADGVEAITLQHFMSTLALSVCERVGTPSDYGAKSTKSLIENHPTHRRGKNRRPI